MLTKKSLMTEHLRHPMELRTYCGIVTLEVTRNSWGWWDSEFLESREICEKCRAALVSEHVKEHMMRIR